MTIFKRKTLDADIENKIALREQAIRNAAPDLLAALEAVSEAFDLRPDRSMEHRAVELACAALKKAKGSLL